MKIAYISIIKDPWGGSEELWAASAKEAIKAGHKVTISAINIGEISSRFQELIDLGATHFLRRGFIKPGTPFKKRLSKKISNFILNQIFNPYMKIFSGNPDIIIYTGSCYSIIYDIEFKKMLMRNAIPYLVINQVNVEYSRPLNNFEAETVKEFYSNAAKVLFVADRNLRTAQRHLLDPIKNSMLVRNPVNISETSLVPYPTWKSQIKFAMVANLLVNHKGHDILFEVLRNQKWLNRNWHLNIYGTGYDEKYIKDLCIFFGLSERITFHGNSTDIRDVWKNNNILLMPSLCEGTPLALVEAMMCGRPVVATDVGGNMEWIEEGVEGFVAEGCNIYSFDNALERAWSNIENWQNMGLKSHNKAIQLYDPNPGKTLLNLILQHGRSS